MPRARKSDRRATTRAAPPQLGLVCQTIGTAVRFRTITLSRYRGLGRKEGRDRLADLYRDNLSRLLSALGFCKLHAIHLYRMPSGLFPMSDEPAGEAILRDMAADMAIVGRLADLWAIRVVMHPDQFVVLNSQRAQVVSQSVTILSKQALWLDLMGLPRSPWTAMILHGGVANRGESLVRTIGTLDPAIRSRLVLENDEWSYGAEAILQWCRAARVPMVFDAHHHLIKEKLRSYDDASVATMMDAAALT